MVIKVIALDIYGTVLATDDSDNELLPRKGLEAFFDKCDSKGIRVVSASDNNLVCLKSDLKESGVDISRFDDFYLLNELPMKDFGRIIRAYGIKPEELLVIGDNFVKDIQGATKVGACSFLVSEYRKTRDELDLSKIEF